MNALLLGVAPWLTWLLFQPALIAEVTILISIEAVGRFTEVIQSFVTTKAWAGYVCGLKHLI